MSEPGRPDTATVATAAAGNPTAAEPSPPAAAEQTPVCAYCGAEAAGDRGRCRSCGGLGDALSRQATQNAMGPWYVRDAAAPFKPGCSFRTLAAMVRRGSVTTGTVLRGPSTHQFWVRAGRAPGVAVLLGVCHACQAAVGPDDFACSACGVALGTVQDRQHLGLGPVRPLPGAGGPAGSAPAPAQAPAAIPAPSARMAQASPAGTTPAAPAAPGAHETPAPAGASDDRVVRRLRRELHAAKRAGLAAWGVAAVALLGGVVIGAAAGPSVLTAEPDPEDTAAADAPAADEAPSTPVPEEPARDPVAIEDPPAPDQSPSEAEAASAPPAEPEALVEARALLARGDRASIEAAIALLRPLAEAGEPASAAGLLEAAEAQLAALELGGLP